MSDKKRLDWLENNISELGIKPAWEWWRIKKDGESVKEEFTDIRKAIDQRRKTVSDKIVVLVGSVEPNSNGVGGNDFTKKVGFKGEWLAGDCEYVGNDTRGIDYTLYLTDGGEHLVHIHNWSHWQGESDSWSLIKVNEAELSPNGEYGKLGEEAGLHNGEIDLETYFGGKTE